MIVDEAKTHDCEEFRDDDDGTCRHGDCIAEMKDAAKDETYG
jgi:hypothetical protein